MVKKLRKDYKPGRVHDDYARSILHLEFIPVSRIKRLKAKKKNYVTQREGWLKFYRWQDRNGKRLTHMIKFT